MGIEVQQENTPPESSPDLTSSPESPPVPAHLLQNGDQDAPKKAELSYRQYLRCRFCCEWWIFRRRMFPEWTAILLYMMYLNLYVSRTLGFYRHRQIVDYIPEDWCSAIATSANRPASWQVNDSCVDHARSLKNQGALQDLIMEMFPNEDGTITALHPEILQGILSMVVSGTIIICSLTPQSPSGRRKPLLFTVNARIMRVLFFVSFLRPLYFLGTSLPGPASKCVGAEEQALRPREIGEIFTNLGLSSANCGDLIYSGHLSSILVMASGYLTYARRLLDPYDCLFQILRVLIIAMLCMQAFCIIVVRNHYTVDLVAASIATIFSWRLYGHEFGETLPVQFLPEYKAALKQPQSDEARERAAKLLQMSDQEFAERVQYEGATLGAIAMAIAVGILWALVAMVCVSMLSADH